ncbi:MAG: RNA polymerase sigma-70 factor [Salinivirgaceae bacterium]
MKKQIALHANRLSISNKDTFEKLFRSEYQPLCRFVLTLTRNKEESEELAQEVFYRLWVKRRKIKITDSIQSYLRTSARNLWIEQGRHLQVKQKYADSAKHRKQHTTPESLLLDKEYESLFDKTIEKLPERCRQIFNLSRNAGLKYHEIAAKLSISVKTVEADMHKTLSALRQTFKHTNK